VAGSTTPIPQLFPKPLQSSLEPLQRLRLETSPAQLFRSSTATPSKSCTTTGLNGFASMGLTAPEKGQAYPKKAKQAASALNFGKEVTLRPYGKDK